MKNGFSIMVALVGALFIAGCGGAEEIDETDGGTDADSDADTDTDVDADTDADTDCDEDAGLGDCGPPWGWYDETSGLCWQDPPCAEPLAWQDAIDYCDALALGGRCDWRLPSISELRSFVRDCPATVTGGECGDGIGGGADLACDGCPGCEGPGMLCGGDEPAGRYFHPDVVGGEIYLEKDGLWSSTTSAFTDAYAWIIGLSMGGIHEKEVINGEYGTPTDSAVMCVRDGL